MNNNRAPLKEGPDQIQFAQNLISSLREPVVVIGSEGKILTCNSSFLHLFKVAPPVLKGKFLVELLEGDQKTSELTALLHILINSQTGVKDFPVLFSSADLKKHQFHINANPLKPGSRSSEMFLLAFQEINISRQDSIDYKKLLNEILSEAPALICTLKGPDHIYELANDKYLELVEYRDIIGKPVKEVLPEFQSQGLTKLLDNVYSTGKPFKGEEIKVEITTTEGTKKLTLDFLYQPIKGVSGEVEGIFVHAVDVTEKVESRQKLLNSRDELGRIIDTVPAMIWIADAEGKLTDLTSNWEDFTGKAANESIGDNWLEQVHPDDRDEVKQKFLSSTREQKFMSISMRLATKSATYRWVINKGAPKYDAEGKFEGLIGTLVDVHEDKMREQLLREKEHKIRMLVEQATVATAVYTGEEMKIDMANNAMIQLWGKDPSVIGKTLREALPELEGQPFHDLLSNVFTSGKTYWGKEDKVDLLIDGKIQTGFFNFTYKPLRNEKGEIYGILNMALDVTDQVMTRRKIQESEKRYEDIILSSPYPIATWKGENYIIEIANDAMIETWGKGKDVFGKPLLEVFPELVEQGYEEILRGVYEKGKPFKGYEMPVELVRNGVREKLHYNFVYYPQRDVKGKIIGIVDIATEVTPQAELKKRLEQSELHYRQMADLMPQKVINTDPEGNPLYFNQNWLDYTGLSSDELKERDWISFMHPEDKPSFVKTWNSSLKTGRRFEMEVRIADRQQNYLWHLSRAEAVKAEDGEVTMWIGTNTEIQKLKEEEKRKEDFLKMVSHELKTPITSIKGYVQLLLNLLKKYNVNLPPAIPLEPSLERIDNQIVRLTRLISEILDLSRLEENELELQKEDFDLNALVEQTVQDIKLTNTQHQLKIFHSHKAVVHADKDRIGQVLINFITNAIKYSPESHYIEIHILKVEENNVAVSVRDQGIGIEKKFHKNIFKRFYRVGVESEETYSGFGIGLYLANEIIDRHNGYIQVKSKKGQGSNFSFVLREN